MVTARLRAFSVTVIEPKIHPFAGVIFALTNFLLGAMAIFAVRLGNDAVVSFQTAPRLSFVFLIVRRADGELGAAYKPCVLHTLPAEAPREYHSRMPHLRREETGCQPAYPIALGTDNAHVLRGIQELSIVIYGHYACILDDALDVAIILLLGVSVMGTLSSDFIFLASAQVGDDIDVSNPLAPVVDRDYGLLEVYLEVAGAVDSGVDGHYVLGKEEMHRRSLK